MPHGVDAQRWTTITRLRQRATRHRRLAEVLGSSQDRSIALSEANRAEAEAGRIEAELSGVLQGTVIPAPRHEQI